MGMTECPAYVEARRQQYIDDLTGDHAYECIPFHSQDSFNLNNPDHPEHSDPPDHSDSPDSDSYDEVFNTNTS